MNLQTAFRLSFYLTLGLACACLVQADAFFLPWMILLLPILAGVFVLAWCKEGEWELSETTANYLGIVIALGTIGWILFQIPHTEEELVAAGLPMPAGLLPHLALLIIVLLVVKLFRPKRLPDFWIIQTIGLMMVTLGCVLAGDAEFGLLLISYLAGLVWCLALFQLERERRLVAHRSVAATAPLFAPMRTASVVPWRYLGAGRVLGWLGAVLLAGGALFVLTPRHGNMQWVPQQLTSTSPQVRTGIESGMDLNRIGDVELSPDPAFSVVVTDLAGKPVALPPDQHWRAEVFDYYFRGHWLTWTQAQERSRLVGPRLVPINRDEAPADPPTAVRLRITLRPMNTGGLVLAEPMNMHRAGLAAQINENPARVELFHELPGCDAVMAYFPTRKATYRYSQVIDRPDSTQRIPARRVNDGYHEYLTTQLAPEAIQEWTRTLVGALPGLSDDERALDELGCIAPEHRARVAQALCDHLAQSREFSYSLTLRRHDRTLDPTADFLLNVKQGHCERYAGGLALMLRAVGVPARVIRGYRGAEPDEQGGFVVRQDQAHSWVQVLLKDDGTWQWLVLDPTPGFEAQRDLYSWTQWMGSFETQKLWKKLVMDFNLDLQSHGWEALEAYTGRPAVLFWGLTGCVAAGSLAWTLWHSRARLARLWSRRSSGVRHSAAAFGLYEQLLRVLAKNLRMAPQPGQTPLEFGQLACAALERGPASFSQVPLEIAHALYRVRFGGHELTAAETAALKNQVAALADALLSSGAKQ